MLRIEIESFFLLIIFWGLAYNCFTLVLLDDEVNWLYVYLEASLAVTIIVCSYIQQKCCCLLFQVEVDLVRKHEARMEMQKGCYETFQEGKV